MLRKQIPPVFHNSNSRPLGAPRPVYLVKSTMSLVQELEQGDLPHATDFVYVQTDAIIEPVKQMRVVFHLTSAKKLSPFW